MQTQESETNLLNIKQAAKLLNVSEVSLRRWTDSGRLACLRVGARRERCFHRADLLAFADAGQTLTLGAQDRAETEEPGGPVDLEGLTIDYGNHLCALYETAAGCTKMGVPFLGDGLRRGDRCLLVGRARVQKQLLNALRERENCSTPFASASRNAVTLSRRGVFRCCRALPTARRR